MKSGDRGSAGLEACIASAFLVSAISAWLAVAYFAFAKVWIGRSAYEVVICLSTNTSEFECERRFRNDIESALPIGTISQLRLSRSSTRAVIEAKFAIDGRDVIRVNDSRKLPLDTGDAK